MPIKLPMPRIARVVRVRRAACVVVTTIASVALLSACGSSSPSSTTAAKPTDLDTARVARSIAQSILAQRHLHAKVVCPVGIPQEAGKTFECVATTPNAKKPKTTVTTPFVVTVESSKGYVTYVGK
jgi:hypothetical protein